MGPLSSGIRPRAALALRFPARSPGDGRLLDAHGDVVLTTSANGRARLWAGRVQSDLDLLTTVRTP